MQALWVIEEGGTYAYTYTAKVKDAKVEDTKLKVEKLGDGKLDNRKLEIERLNIGRMEDKELEDGILNDTKLGILVFNDIKLYNADLTYMYTYIWEWSDDIDSTEDEELQDNTEDEEIIDNAENNNNKMPDNLKRVTGYLLMLERPDEITDRIFSSQYALRFLMHDVYYG